MHFFIDKAINIRYIQIIARKELQIMLNKIKQTVKDTVTKENIQHLKNTVCKNMKDKENQNILAMTGGVTLACLVAPQAVLAGAIAVGVKKFIDSNK